MSSGHHKQGSRRKNGDWKKIAQGRNNSRRDLATCRPNYGSGTLIKVTDVGSAAYRRLLKSRASKR